MLVRSLTLPPVRLWQPLELEMIRVMIGLAIHIAQQLVEHRIASAAQQAGSARVHPLSNPPLI
jgi:thymidylate synthase ThyX